MTDFTIFILYLNSYYLNYKLDFIGLIIYSICVKYKFVIKINNNFTFLY